MRGRYSIALSFLIPILLGAVLLASPWARAAGSWGNWRAALFTSCSAICVTGLTVVEIAEEYTQFGQIALMILVEVGALGLMTLSTFMLVAIGRRLSFAREFSLMNAYGGEDILGVKGLIMWLVGSMVLIEAIGAGLLYCRFHDWYYAIFYSVMSFCNAGFGILPNSLANFADEPYVLMVMACETIFGGLGTLVIYNLCTFWFLRRKSGGRGRLTLHSKIVLRFTLYLLVIAFLVFLLLEWNGALREFSIGKKLWVAFYQAVTPRTCGFTVVPMESLKPGTLDVITALMFIGGGPGSVAAGIKVTTLAVLIYTIVAMCKADDELVIYKRTISLDVIRESIVILILYALIIIIGYEVLATIEGMKPVKYDNIYFEAISAVTTTGLSIGNTTKELSPGGQCVVMALMFFGRLGALTVVMMIGGRESNRLVRYPNEEVIVG